MAVRKAIKVILFVALLPSMRVTAVDAHALIAVLMQTVRLEKVRSPWFVTARRVGTRTSEASSNSSQILAAAAGNGRLRRFVPNIREGGAAEAASLGGGYS